MKLLLFDIDGVIVKARSRGHQAAFREGMKKVYGIDFVPQLKHEGLTDRIIIYEELKNYGLSEKEITSKLQKCMHVMKQAFEQSDNSDLVAISGIEELLEKLGNNKEVLIGLLTGNVEGIAYGKMQILGLRDYFKIGGFGSDPHKKRSDLVDVVKKKAQNMGYKLDEIYIIGDTPRDIQTGKEAKVKTVAIATGPFSMDELRKHNPDYLFENFKGKNTTKFVKILEEN